MYIYNAYIQKARIIAIFGKFATIGSWRNKNSICSILAVQ